MRLPKAVIDELTVSPGHRPHLDERDTRKTKTDWLGASGKSARLMAEQDLAQYREELAASQELLYATDAYAILVVLQALDAAGKDGTIKHVMTGVNPQGCSVTPFKAPTAEELAHDFLWRCERRLPARGQIGIFNRSYYEEVLVTRVHPELLVHERLDTAVGKHLWEARYEDINAFEHHLARAGTRIVKLFLHVSKEEQKKRFLERLEDPTKHWKFSPSDLAERDFFDDYLEAYEEVLAATSTTWAPWYVVPADHKYLARALVGGLLVEVIDELDLRIAPPTPEQLVAIDQARAKLAAG